MLAVGETGVVLTALFFARQVLRMTDRMTIYTNGNEELAKDLDAAIAAAPAPMTVDPREIAKLVKGPNGAEVEVHFKNGDSQTEGFIAHKPKSKLRGTLAEQLGLELTPKKRHPSQPSIQSKICERILCSGRLFFSNTDYQFGQLLWHSGGRWCISTDSSRGMEATAVVLNILYFVKLSRKHMS